MRAFHLYRDVDATGISGTGIVAEGVQFQSGKVVLAWLTKVSSVAVYDNIEAVEAIHGHNGQTRIVWEDGLRSEDAADMLGHAMREISDECWAAGWIGGLEFSLWAMVLGGCREYGAGRVTEDQVNSLRGLSQRAGGWRIWKSGEGDVFVPMAEWLKVYAEHPLGKTP